MDMEHIKNRIKEIVIEVLGLKIQPKEIQDQEPFFGTDDHPGLIQDSLAVLEIATRIGEEFDILPEEFNEDAFLDVETLAHLIQSKVDTQE